MYWHAEIESEKVGDEEEQEEEELPQMLQSYYDPHTNLTHCYYLATKR